MSRTSPSTALPSTTRAPGPSGDDRRPPAHAAAAHPRDSRDSREAWSPAADIHETDTELTFAVELPGITPDQVRVTADARVLTISGTRTTRDRDEARVGGREHMAARNEGAFTCRFELPPDVDPALITAQYAHGLLDVRVPKGAAAEPTLIRVTTAADRGDVGAGFVQP
jgi:HSP20 family protein